MITYVLVGAFLLVAYGLTLHHIRKTRPRTEREALLREQFRILKVLGRGQLSSSQYDACIRTLSLIERRLDADDERDERILGIK